MDTTKDFMARIRARYNLTSDYQLAKFLGVTRQRISGYKGRDITLGDETAIKVAEALELPPAYVLNCMAAERAKRPEVKKAWQRAAAALATAASVLFFLGFLPVDGIDSVAAFVVTFATPVTDYTRNVSASG